MRNYPSLRHWALTDQSSVCVRCLSQSNSSSGVTSLESAGSNQNEQSLHLVFKAQDSILKGI